MDAFNNMAPRERLLAVVTLLLVVGGGVYLGYTRSFAHLESLDRRIERLQEGHLLNEELALRRNAVLKAFAEVTSEHSSKWSEAEIRDRLMKELNNLAKGVVKIPELKGGTLKEGGEGYREFAMTLKIPKTSIKQLVKYLERLRGSRQSLRIDSLDVTRRGDHTNVVAKIGVTRTVVDGVQDDAVAPEDFVEAEALLTNASFEDWSDEAGGPVGWLSEECTTKQAHEFATHERRSLQVTATADAARVFQGVALDAGGLYRLAIDVTAPNGATLTVSEARSGTPLAGSITIQAKPEWTLRHILEFRVPKGDGGTAALRAPDVLLNHSGDVVYLDKAVLQKVEE